MDLLFFSRGRGRGHAIPDMAIMEAVHSLNGNINWQFVSYGTGASTLSEFGYKAVNLDLLDDNPFLETVTKACQVIRTNSPRFVVSHEEPAAILAAKIFDIPSIFITEFFLPANYLLTQTLGYAEIVIMLAEPGWFDEPPYLKQKIKYVGSMVREFKYHKHDREKARQELGMGNDLTVLSVLPGGWATEQREPVAELLLPAFARLEKGKKLLCWVAGNDFAALSDCVNNMNDVRVHPKLWPIEQLMVASDLIITKGNRITIMEASELGIPTISLSHGSNPIDDIIVSHIKTNTPLRVKGITSDYLARCMDAALQHRESQDRLEHRTTGPSSVAELLLSEMKRLERLWEPSRMQQRVVAIDASQDKGIGENLAGAALRQASIHVHRPGGLGDALMSTPALRELKRIRPECHIHFHTKRPDSAQGLPYLDTVSPIESRPAESIWIGYERAIPSDKHLAKVMGESIGVRVNDIRPDCAVDEKLIQRYKDAWQHCPHPHILVQRHASTWTPNKDWPDEYWKKLVLALLKERTVIDIGYSSADEPISSLPNHIDLRGAELKELVASVAAADILVAPDSGPIHIAAAVRTPAVVIVGGYSHPENTAYPENTTLFTPIHCSPCWLRTPCPIDRECLREITPEIVEKAIMDIWKKNEQVSVTEASYGLATSVNPGN